MYIVREDLGENGEAIPMQRVGSTRTELVQADGLNEMQDGLCTSYDADDVCPAP